MAKKIGILGGMTPESTTTYYETIIHKYEEKSGDYNFPEIIIYSVSFQQFVDWMHQDKWDNVRSALAEGLNSLAKAGADFAVIATNTMHLLFDDLQKESDIPLLSIVDAAAASISKKKLDKVILLGTKFTMSRQFYQEGLNRHQISTIVPNTEEQDIIHKIIFDELGRGIIKDESRKKYLDIIQRLHQKGGQGVILGCTEIPLLIKNSDCDLPLFDTAAIHAEKALEFALL